MIGERADVFSGLPWSVYVPPHHDVAIAAEEDCEIAICSAPAVGQLPARVIPPSDVETLTRGKGTNTRHVRNILSETARGREPAGRRGDHARAAIGRAIPRTSTIATTCRRNRCSRRPTITAFRRRRVSRCSASIPTTATLDETMAVGDRDVVLVPRGYHPVGAAHGYDLYYLNVMAGPKRTWRFHNDPAHEWLMK